MRSKNKIKNKTIESSYPSHEEADGDNNQGLHDSD